LGGGRLWIGGCEVWLRVVEVRWWVTGWGGVREGDAVWKRMGFF
jgi:hypothetical protein